MFVKLKINYIFAELNIKVMTEAFLHYLWQNRLFDFLNVQTTDGEPLQIVLPGYHNMDAGPDFKQAVIQIGSMKWAGDVEIHIRSSDWFRHKHQQDEKYKSVALHVVYEHDMEVERSSGEFFPTLQLKSYIPKDMYERYLQLVDSLDLLSCRGNLDSLEGICFQSQISSMAMERLLRKQEDVMNMLSQCHYDWRETLFRQIALGFGFKTNAMAFELLARSLPYKIIVKHSDSALQVNALIFGQAGMLELPHVDAYYDSLKYEYEYLRYKYQLDPIGEHHWNLLRLRPPNFPCVRLAQFSALLLRSSDLLSAFVNNPSVSYLSERLSVTADDYWTTHYHFGKETMLKHSVQMGETAVNLLLINTVVPVVFAFHRFSGNEQMLESTVSILEQLPFEDNKLTRVFKGTPFPQNTALDSQALIELLQQYCKAKRCLECGVGECLVRKIRQ